jgi:hypothetical protein
VQLTTPQNATQVRNATGQVSGLTDGPLPLRAHRSTHRGCSIPNSASATQPPAFWPSDTCMQVSCKRSGRSGKCGAARRSRWGRPAEARAPSRCALAPRLEAAAGRVGRPRRSAPPGAPLPMLRAIPRGLVAGSNYVSNGKVAREQHHHPSSPPPGRTRQPLGAVASHRGSSGAGRVDAARRG